MRNSALTWMLFQSPQTEDMEEVLSLQTTLFIVTATDGYNLLFILLPFDSIPHSLHLRHGKPDLTFQWWKGDKGKTGGNFLPSEKTAVFKAGVNPLQTGSETTYGTHFMPTTTTRQWSLCPFILSSCSLLGKNTKSPKSLSSLQNFPLQQTVFFLPLNSQQVTLKWGSRRETDQSKQLVSNPSTLVKNGPTVGYLLIPWEPGDCILLPRQLIHIISKAQWTVSANWFEWKILHLASCLSFVYLTKCEYSVCLRAFIQTVVKFRMKTWAEWLDIALSSSVWAEDHHKIMKGCSSLTRSLCWKVAYLTPLNEMEDLIQSTIFV